MFTVQTQIDFNISAFQNGNILIIILNVLPTNTQLLLNLGEEIIMNM